MTFSPAAERSLRKLDKTAQIEILRYLRRRIETTEDPRRFGHALHGSLAGLWRYRVRDLASSVGSKMKKSPFWSLKSGIGVKFTGDFAENRQYCTEVGASLEP